MTDHHDNDTEPSQTPQIPGEASDWLDYGITRGWISDSFCGTHDALDALTSDEAHEWESGHDPCMFVVRLLNP